MQRILEPEVMDTAEDAEEYDAMDFAASDGLFADRAAALVEARSAPRVLDVGTGTAKIPILVAARVPDATFVAVDMAEAMLRVAERNLISAGLASRCALVRMDGKALGVAPASFDLVMSNSVAHHVPEPIDLFREIARAVRPEGAILVRDLIRPETPDGARAIVARYAPDDSPHQKRLFFDSLCAALTLAEVEALVREAGLVRAVVRRVSDRHWSVEREAG